MHSLSQNALVRFGVFEVDAAAGELRKNGIRIKLHEKPFEVLLALLEHPGEVVTRRELQERLWSQDTFVEFENGLNNAISRLRDALGDAAESPRFIETVPRRGYRFLPEIAQSLPPSQSVRLRQWLMGAGITLAATLVVVGLFRFVHARVQPIQSLAVLPFRDLATGTADNSFAAGMTDAVTTELAKLGVSKVISETSVEKFENTNESVPQIARALGVDAIVEGAVLRDGNQVRITVQLIRADTDRHIWANSYERQMTNILALQDQVALGVARAIDLKLSPGASGAAVSAKQVNANAYDAYLEGRYYVLKRNDEFFRAKDYFEQSIQLDPNYGPAYAGLSEYYMRAETLPPKEALPKARDYAEEALRLDPDSPESHLSLANIYFFYDWNWAGADREFKRAIALAPGLARAHRWYSAYLGAMGRNAQSMQEAQRAEELDPLSIAAHDFLAKAAGSLGQYDRALEESHQILTLDPNNPLAYADMCVFQFDKGAYKDSLADAEKGIALTHREPFFLSLAALDYGHLGKMEQAKKLVEEMKADSRRRYVSPVYFATALVGMNKKKEAMDALEKAYKIHDGNMVDLVDLNDARWFEPLHPDPSFQHLLRDMNLSGGK